MKLSAKMALCMLLVLGVLFALCGYALTGASFRSALDSVVQQSTALHTQQKTMMLRELCAARDKTGALEDYDFVLAAQQTAMHTDAGMTCAVVTKGTAALYNDLPQALGKMEQTQMVQALGSCRLQRADGGAYLTMASPVVTPERTVYLLHAFDVSELYARRAQQTQLFWKLYAGMMLAAAAVCMGVAAWFTRPVARLNRAAKAVANGAYDAQVARPGSDEIAQLSQSFDAMARAVQEKVASLELSVRQREDFMGAFTHELKTPMTAMMGYAALLQREDIAPPQREKALRYLHSETKRLEALSQKLLMLLGLSDETVALCAVETQALFAAVQNALPEETVQRNPVRFTVPPALPAVAGDADLLVDLLRNLVENAAHASPEGAAVEVCAQGDAQDAAQDAAGNPAQNPVSGVRITVRDSGCGIPPQEISRLTEPFYSVDKSRSRAQGGSGLGLSICERIAQLHGAQLSIAARPEGGTEVSLALRAVQPEEARADDA